MRQGAKNEIVKESARVHMYVRVRKRNRLTKMKLWGEWINSNIDNDRSDRSLIEKPPESCQLVFFPLFFLFESL
jgi:hypothetical protein